MSSLDLWTNKIKIMKKLFFFVLVIIGIISCDNNYDVVVRMENGVICKYKCKQDTDTTDCTKYCFYNNNLISQSTYVDGKLNGSAIDYYPDGLIYILMNYHNDKKHGIKKVFDEYGTLLRRSLYLQDKQVLFESTMINTKNEHLRRKQ